MNTVVYFIRHAKPDTSIKDDLTRPLSLEGIEKSKELITLFKEIKIDYHNNFLEIVNITPYIMKMEFNNDKYISREEIKV